MKMGPGRKLLDDYIFQNISGKIYLSETSRNRNKKFDFKKNETRLTAGGGRRSGLRSAFIR